MSINIGFLKRIFSGIKNEERKGEETFQNETCAKIRFFQKEIEKILAVNQYIAKSDYCSLTKEFEIVAQQLIIMEKNQVLEDFSRKNGLKWKETVQVLDLWKNLDKIVETHNEEYISNEMRREKEYLDQILQEVDSRIRLDDDQRRVVLTDEDYCLVIAGAGAGKTTTVAAKVKYLTDKKNIDPKQILVVSFTNKAVEELKEKINKELRISCPITTFHAAGNAILRRQSTETLQVADPSKLYYVILDYFRGGLLRDERQVKNLLLFFGSYFEAPYEGKDLESFFRKVSGINTTTLKSDLNEVRQTIMDRRSGKKITISNEILRSMEEVEIANFLYLNQIEYEYEPLYPYQIPGSRKPYTPDFLLSQDGKKVYLEHFGITESGKNDRYSAEQLEWYKQVIQKKIQLHQKHGTELIYTFSQYNDGRSLQAHLTELLMAVGFELRPRAEREVVEKLVASEENRYIRRLIQLICRFITNFKVNGYGAEEFSRMYQRASNVRNKLFLNICNSCYLEYQRVLKENQMVDFQDMINESARILREKKEEKEFLDFKYIIVDEYQDISRQRFDLTTALSELCDAKIIAVGDDWQSIYAFSGADVELFTHFTEKMGYGKLLKIVRTYRNSQEVIDIAGGFIQKNPTQITKKLLSPKNIKDPVIIYTYDATQKRPDESNRTGALFQLAHGVEVALEQIIEFAEKENNGYIGNVLLLGRFGFDGDQLEKSGLFEYIRRGNQVRSVRYPKINITFMTAHASKGLGYDNVIVINGKNETYGFPAKVEDDPVLRFVTKTDRSMDYAEERRLFYVAMTRTKNRVYFIAPEQNPSEFLLEIKRDYKNVSLKGRWNEEKLKSPLKKRCPICGYPLQFRYRKSYGLRLYICTNEPELCGFLSNDLRGGKMSIMKCDQCVDGYMIIKGKGESKKEFFLGCTNYRRGGTGCNNTMSPRAYHAKFGLHEDEKMEAEEEKYTIEKEDVKKKGEKGLATEQIQRKEKKYQWGNKAENESMAEHVGEQRATFLMLTQILNCVDNVSQYKFFGITVMLDILKGADSEKIRRYRLYQIPQYGKLKDVDRRKLYSIIEWMIKKGYLLQTKGQYPVLHPTDKGKKFEECMTEGELKEVNKIL